MTKKFLYINRKPPHGTIHALESLEVVLIGAVFDQDVSLAFVDDGVYQLLKQQDTSAIGSKNFASTYKALGDYGVDKVYIEKESLDARGLSKEDLLSLTCKDQDRYEKDAITIVDSEALADIIDKQDIVLNF